MLTISRTLGIALVIAVVTAAYAYVEARRDPIVRQATLRLANWPKGQSPIRAVLLSDIHMASPTMDARRLSRIVAQINRLHPDIVLIAGDFISGNEPDGAARQAPGLIEPLSALEAPLGVVAVPGNHDYTTGIPALKAALDRAHVTLLANRVLVRGPLAIAAIGDFTTDHADVAAINRALKGKPGIRLALTHSPDVVPELPQTLDLVLAGHTHCGQIILPLFGPIAQISAYGRRFLCGVKHEGRRTIVVTGGLGTSEVPFRLGAPPDMWLLKLGPR